MVQPGWYPDPNGSGTPRYWDGTRWTMPPRSHGAPSRPWPPVARPARHDRKLVIGLIAALAVVLIALTIGLVVLFRSDGTASSASGTGRLLSGNSDDWLASVCKPGTYMDGGTSMRDALASGLCMSAADGTVISAGKFESQYEAENTAANLGGRGGSYAIGATSNGTTWLFMSSWQDKGQSLTPLTAFGFAIH